MLKTMKLLAAGIALSAAAFFAGGSEAQAASNDYCREYTRTVYIGGRSQDAYGTACLQSDGSWMIVGEGLGNDIPDNVSNVNYVIHDNRREVIPTRVVYYEQPRVNYYRSRPSVPIFTWYSGGHYRNGHNVVYKKYNYNNRYDRHDNRRDNRWDRNDRRGHDNGGRGNGHR